MFGANRAILGLSIAATIALVSGCATAETAEGGDANAPAKISFLTFQSPALTKEFWEERVAEVQEQYPELEVEILYTPDLDRQGYAKQLLATGELPDVMWDAPVAEFVEAGALLPYPDEANDGIAVDPAVGTIDGERYTMTHGAQVIPLMYYNKDIFDEVGLEVPTTFDEMVDHAKKLKAAGHTPFLIGGASDSWTSTLFLDGIINSEVLGDNPDWILSLKAGDVSFTDENFKAAVEKWYGLFKAGYFNTDALTVDYAQLAAKFANGEGAMYPMGSWAATTKSDFNLGVFPIPAESGNHTFGAGFGQVLSVSATTKFPAQAQAFAMTMAKSQQEAIASLTTDGLIPVLDGFQMPEDQAPLVKETYEVYLQDSTKRVQPFGWAAANYALPTGFGQEFDKGAQKLITGESTVDQFLDELDRAFDDLNS